MATSPSERSPSEPSPGEDPAARAIPSGEGSSGAAPRAADPAAAANPAAPPARRARPSRRPAPLTAAEAPARRRERRLIGDDTGVRVVDWRGGKLREWQGIDGLAEAHGGPDGQLWIDLAQPSSEQVAHVAQLLGLHPLIAEDIVEGNQRAKIEVTDELVHIVMFALEYRGEMLQSEIDFVLGDRFLLTVHDAAWDPRATMHLRDGLEPVISRGTDHLLWALVDALVDSYFPFIDKMGDEIDAIEDEVVTRASPEVLSRLFGLKRDLLTARRAAAPVREIFNQLTNRDLDLIDRDEVIYFRDVYDHLIRLTDELDNYRELVSGALDVYLSTVNNNLSLIMKRLTGVTVILAGIGAIAGIFGMSEAASAVAGGEGMGFWLVTLSTVAIATSAAALLRKVGWI